MNIKSKHIASLLAITAMSFGIAASAQQGPASGMGPNGHMDPGMAQGGCPMMGEHMRGNHAARAEKHLADLKAQLKITPQQEPLWQAFADKLKASMGGMKPMPDASQPATAPERMNRMVEHMRQHTAAMEGVSESFKRLYDALTPEQKAVADKYHPFGEHMGKRGQGGQMGGRMGGQMGGGMGPGGPRGPAPDAAPAR